MSRKKPLPPPIPPPDPVDLYADHNPWSDLWFVLCIVGLAMFVGFLIIYWPRHS